MTCLIAFQLFALVQVKRFECQLFLYSQFISFTLNSYLLQNRIWISFLFCSNCIIQIITLSSISLFIRKCFFSKFGRLFLKLDTLFQNSCPFSRLFSKLICFKFNKVSCSYLQEIQLRSILFHQAVNMPIYL